jgi:hypothetical protein
MKKQSCFEKMAFGPAAGHPPYYGVAEPKSRTKPTLKPDDHGRISTPAVIMKSLPRLSEAIMHKRQSTTRPAKNEAKPRCASRIKVINSAEAEAEVISAPQEY